MANITAARCQTLPLLPKENRCQFHGQLYYIASVFPIGSVTRRCHLFTWVVPRESSTSKMVEVLPVELVRSRQLFWMLPNHAVTKSVSHKANNNFHWETYKDHFWWVWHQTMEGNRSCHFTISKTGPILGNSQFQCHSTLQATTTMRPIESSKLYVIQ